MQTQVLPTADTLVKSPLRHRWRLRLAASPADVWALVGEHGRLPEYSLGIARVRVEREAEGEVRVCEFHPMPDMPEGAMLRERIVATAPGVGYVSMTEPGNAFGLENDLTRVTLEPTSGGTLFTWDQHYDHADLAFARGSFEDGLADIAQNLVRRFGGEVVERFVDGPR